MLTVAPTPTQGLRLESRLHSNWVMLVIFGLYGSISGLFQSGDDYQLSNDMKVDISLPDSGVMNWV